MSFQAKERGRYSNVTSRDRKIAALAAENSPEARKARRTMNDQIIPKRQAQPGNYYLGKSGKGKVRMTGSNVQCDRINSTLRAKGAL